MSDDVKDLLDRAAADSLRGIRLDLPTEDDVARSETTSLASDPGADLIPLDATRRRARWPLGLAAAVLALLAIGGGILAVQSADDPSPATPTTVPVGDPRQRLLAAIDSSVTEVFEVHYEGITDDRRRAASGGVETVTVWDGDKSGSYVNRPDGQTPVTKISDSTTSYFQTGPDQWVSIAAYQGPNPLREFGQAAEDRCIYERDGTIIVDLVDRAGSIPPRDPPLQTPCGRVTGIQYEVTLDSAGRVASIGSGDRPDTPTSVRFEYSGFARLRMPDPALVTTLPNGVGPSVDPVTGYWPVDVLDSVGPTTTLMSPP